MKKRNFYITTTLPYVNDNAHLGFALEIIQADVIARYYRQKNYQVFFNTGTDEHGLKIYRKAKESNLKPQEYCDQLAQQFKQLKKHLNLSYNSFVRTTDRNHIKAVQEFWQRCFEKKDIYKKDYQVKYCVGCELEKTESELVNNKCPIHPKQSLEIIKEENYFFRYSKYQKKLLAFYQKNFDFVLPKSRFNEIKKFTKQGLKDFSVSRLKEKMPWGIPVPNDDKHVIFVWFDALINYLSCLGWPEDKKKFNDFWPGFQVAGKDNLRQQSSMWQAMLLSAGLPLSKKIFIHGFITVNGQKMSKTLGNIIDPVKLVEKYSRDSVRYFLLREISSTEDGDFTFEKFEQRHNSDLAKGIGNLLARVIALSKKISQKPIKLENSKLKNQIIKSQKKYQKSLTEFNFSEALVAIWQIISFCDKHISQEKPWQKTKKQTETINDLVLALNEIAQLLKPFLPETSEKILKQLKTKKSQPLFPRI
jgi:methionyl-tRNA synthetase